MRHFGLAVGVIVLGLLAGAVGLAAELPGDKATAPTEIARVGLYDSRAVAAAYCGSDRHEAIIRRLKEAVTKAKASGDAEAIKKADRTFWEAAKRLHRQGFSTYPVDDILQQMPEETKLVQEKANVTVLISKWDEKGLAKVDKAEKTDVTELLVDAMKPKTRQRRNAMEIQKVKPIPPKQYEELLKKEAGEHYGSQ